MEGAGPTLGGVPDSPSTLRTLGQLSTVGLSFVLALVMGFGGGYWLDGWLGTRPWLAFAGFFLGLAAGVLNVYRIFQATMARPGPVPGAAPGAGSASISNVPRMPTVPADRSGADVRPDEGPGRVERP